MSFVFGLRFEYSFEASGTIIKRDFDPMSELYIIEAHRVYLMLTFKLSVSVGNTGAA